jgi:glycosyltransferase involved in cell wall biosynthesis
MSFSIVVPTIGRKSLHRLLEELDGAAGPQPEAVVVVDDRVDAAPPLLLATRLPVIVRRSGARGPAAARNVGWRAVRSRWICFLDDDVIPQPNLFAALADDPEAADAAGAAGSQAVIEVPGTPGRRATDDDRRTQRLPARNGSPPIWPTDARLRWLSAGSTNAFPLPIARTPTLPCGSPWQATPLRRAHGAPPTRLPRPRLGAAPYLVFHPGAAVPARRPSADRSAAMVAALAAAGHRGQSAHLRADSAADMGRNTRRSALDIRPVAARSRNATEVC